MPALRGGIKTPRSHPERGRMTLDLYALQPPGNSRRAPTTSGNSHGDLTMGRNGPERAFILSFGFRVRRRGEPPLFQQRLDDRIASTERPVQLGDVRRALARKDHFAKALTVGARHSPVLREPVIGIVVQHLAPEIGVIARRVAALPDVGEIGRAIPWRHLKEVDVKAL